MTDEMQSETSPRTVAVFELSRRIRSMAVLLVILLGLMVIVLYTHKPVVTDDTLNSAIFTPQFADRLMSENRTAIETCFRTYHNSFDYPWNDFAQRYVNRQDEADRAQALYSFLKNESVSRGRHLLTLIEADPGIEQAFSEYLESAEERWEVFTVPVLQIRVSRDEVIFYLAIAFLFIHVLMIVKADYLHLLRAKLGITLIPDPSLLTATMSDVEVLDRFQRGVVAIVQLVMVWCPLAALLIVGGAFYYRHGIDFGGHTRFGIGVVALLTDAVIAPLLWHRRGASVTAQRVSLFGNGPSKQHD